MSLQRKVLISAAACIGVLAWTSRGAAQQGAPARIRLGTLAP